MHTVISFSVRCIKSVGMKNPVYRIFLDKSLVVERPFWPKTPDYYIEEQLTMTNDDAAHSIYIKNIFADRGDIFIHDVKFLNGSDLTPVDVNYTVIDSTGFIFKLPKR